ncbi:MAG: DEAD/DEAH box helicase [Nitrososphaerota archaeon]|nr:DEAD/DEAH box helicase [Aigarchaeota archaeon]MDW8076974.1 DEAD/DEAH box helicase [Nitrososphaerota archaeon]
MGELTSEGVLELLAKPVRTAFVERFGELTPPQIESIPKILEGKNLLLMAPTGTGKTEAALLPILSNLLQNPGLPGIKALYITPLRALNRDMLERFDWWAKKLDINVSVRHGDTAVAERRAQTLIPPDILITTPETLQAILCGKVLRKHLKSVKWVVVDEVHELATDKRGAQLSIALERLLEIVGSEFQRIGLSATIGSPKTVAKFLVGAGRECEIVRVPVAKSMKIDVLYPVPEAEDAVLAEELAILPDVAARLRTIRRLVESHGSTLIFTNTRPLAEILTNRFRAWDENFSVGIHHGSLAKSARVSTEQGLKAGTLLGIVCTSSLELGIDVGRVDLCIQYNSPREVTRLIQRVGRSGHRIGRVANGVILVMDSDDALESIAIARRALAEELEEVRIPTNCLDVLMHQLAGLLIERGRVNVEDALSIFRRAYGFSELDKHTLLRVLEHMKALNICVLTDDGYFWKPIKSKPLYDYYFGNLSMIPEEKQYLVVQEDTSEPIGILDEEFVAEYGEPGTRFILLGKAWEILSMLGEKIYVNKLDEYEGAVPSWVGDEIPVPYEVAEEVGSLRAEYEERLRKGEPHEVICADIAKRYGVSEELISRSMAEVRAHIDLGIPVPTNSRILVEKSGEYTIIHIHAGLRINRTLAKVISFLVSEKVGMPISVQQDPYRIVIRSKHVYPELILDVIKSLSEGDFGEVLRKAIEGSTLFRRRLVHVARKMGVISKEASILDVNLSKIVEVLKGTIVYDEAISYCLFQDFDEYSARELIRSIVMGNYELVTYSSPDTAGPSPLALLTLRRYQEAYETVSSDRIEKLVLMAVRARLMNETGILICSDCYQYFDKVVVKDVEERPSCPACGSRKLGFLKGEVEDVYGLISRKGKPINKKEKELLKEIERSSDLVEKYGKAAIVAISGKGFTVKDAAKVLQKEGSLTNRLIQYIIEEEKNKLIATFK